MIDKSKEDYLRTIYFFYEKNKKYGIKSVDIAKEMGISKASVSDMVKNLAKEGLLKVEPYSKIFFTQKGLEEARKVMHNHRVLEVFLNKILGYSNKTSHDQSKIHEEAHRLEHAFSDETIKRLDNYLKNPTVNPFGKQIPHKKKKK